MPPWWYW